MKLSVIVPCYNEEAVLDRLLEVLTAELAAITSDYEVLLVDDGSRDRTLPMLREACSTDPRLRYLALSRNFGKESAMLAGLSQASGDAVAIIDADLQHPPRSDSARCSLTCNRGLRPGRGSPDQDGGRRARTLPHACTTG